LRALAFLALGACWTSSPAPSAPAPHAALAPSGTWHTEWRGTYTCAQGVTALQLSLDRTCPNDAECRFAGVFRFGGVPENPGVPDGAYRITGTMTTDARDELVITALPGEWLDQPEGYEPVGFTATSDPGRTRLHGTIQNPDCSALDVTRVDGKQPR
jgi:hypothetical protein